MQVSQAKMKGSRDMPSDCDFTPQEKGDSGAQKLTSKNSSRNTSPKAVVDTQPNKAPDKKGTTELQSRAPSQSGKGSTSSPINGRVSRTPKRNGSRGKTPTPVQSRSATHPHASPDGFVVRKSQGAHVNFRSSRRPGWKGESTQAIANEDHKNGEHVSPREIEVQKNGEHASPREIEVQKNGEQVSPRENEVQKNGEHVSSRENEAPNSGEHVSPRPIEVPNNGEHGTGSPRETENIRPRSSNTPDSERPRSSLSCNCGGRKCAHEPSRDHVKDHAFMDGFDTQEQPWKPGKKVIDHLNDQPRSEYRWKSSRKSIPGADRMQSRAPEWRSEDPPVSRKGPGGRDGGAAQVQREYDPYGNPLNVPEWEWHPGKGRGNGPVPGEWLPPFRGFSTRAEGEPPPFLKGKGSGRRHSDEWLPPFRVVDRPASWHRSKGAGSGPPANQWLPPWGTESATDAERGDSATSARSGRKHFPASCPLK